MTKRDEMTVDATLAGDEDEEAGFGALNTVRGGLPLQRLAVEGRITGLLYRLTVAQTFINAYAEPLEATYLFPLPARAGVTRFRLRVGERVIEGVLKERDAARDDYDQALRQGHRAAIAEEERPEVFTIRAGNIPPGEAVGVDLELAGPLAFADGEATFRFPLVVAPRYMPGIPLDGPRVGLGTAPDTDVVPDASRISPPVLLPGQPNPVYLSFRLELDPAGLPFADPLASLHALRLGQTAAGLRVVELTPGVERLDRDVILRFRVGEDRIGGSLSVYRHLDGEATLLLTVVPPVLPDSFRPRDVVVLLDRSGSMGGWKMVAARRAAARLIDTLTERDRFGLILFDDQIEEPTPGTGRLIPASDRHCFRAVEYLARVEARGGTEIAPALSRALQYFPTPDDPDRERILLFITDGQVGDEDALLRQVRAQARGRRIFTVGIDQAINASLLERLAAYGGGYCDLVESEGRLDEVLHVMHRRLSAPLLTDIRLEPALADHAPDVSDLFPGVPLRLGGRWRGSWPAQFTVTGHTAAGEIFQHTLVPVETTDPAVRTLWARARVLDLEHRFATDHQRPADRADAITAFSLKYGVLCRFTAFVAVDDAEVVNPGGQGHPVVQAVEAPAGWGMPRAGRPPFRISNSWMTDDGLSDNEELMDFLDMPGFLSSPRFGLSLRRPAMRAESLPEPRQSPAWRQRPESSAPAPSWVDRLETLLRAPTLDAAARLTELRNGLVKLDALGEMAAALVAEGRDLIPLLERDRPEGWKRLVDWLRRVRELLAQPAAQRWRRIWWK